MTDTGQQHPQPQQQFKGVGTKSAIQTSNQLSRTTTSTSHNQNAGTNTTSSHQPGWSSNSQQHQQRNDSYQNYGNQSKPPNQSGWSGYGQHGKDWSNQGPQYNQHQMNANKNGYQGGGGGGGGGDFNYNQHSSIQHPSQIYPNQRNYGQNQQQYGGYGQGNNVGDQYRSFGGNQDNRGNWNNSGQSNWSNQGNWSGGGGWGDWNGPRNNPRRGDDGPHIPPFPQAWQHGQQHMNQGGNRNEMKGWGGGNKWNQSWDNQGGGGGRHSGNNSRFSRGDGHAQQERYSSHSREKSNRELWSPADSKRKDRSGKSSESDKPIQASEIKAYLYAWLGMRRNRPHYDIHPVGERPDMTFRCELRVTGYKFVGVGEALSKKDAQTDAAWNFAEYLVRQGQLKRSELPPKSQKNADDSNEDFGTVKEHESEKPSRDTNRQQRKPRVPKGPPVPLMSIVTTPVGNIPPFPAFEREPWVIPPHRRGGPWMEGPIGPWRGGGGGGSGGRRGGWGRPREIEEAFWPEEELYGQHPEDIFISRMIMNQQEAAMGNRRFEGRPGEWVSLAPARTRNVTTLDDRHVMGKHAAIYPHEEELKSVHELVTLVERALKALSDQFVDEDHPIAKDEDVTEEEDEPKKEEKEGIEEEEEKKEEGEDSKKNKIQILKRPKKRPRKVPDTRPRVLCAVNRVGSLAKGLLITGDMTVCLVLLCGSLPTKALLERIMKHLPAKIQDINKDLDYDLSEQDAGFVIVGKLETAVTLSVCLTCTALTSQEKEKKNKKDQGEKQLEEKDNETNREEEETEEREENNDADIVKNVEDIPDMLPKSLLLGALAQLRHSKWFQARASQQDWGVVITRILRDLKMRNPVWAPLSDWALENLVYVALSSSTEHMSPGDAFRRFFEVLAGGILLEDRTGVQDPCERTETDVLDCCTSQQLEDITRHAQNALLKIAFRKVHEVLDMEKMTMLNPQNPGEFQAPGSKVVTEEEGARKRRLEHNSSDSLAESPKRSLTDEEGDADTQQNLAELSISDQMKAAGSGGGLSPSSNSQEESMDTNN